VRVAQITVGATWKLDPGLNVLSAENAYGKTLAMTAIPWCLGLEP
jgi:DNA repair ATPase RecN